MPSLKRRMLVQSEAHVLRMLLKVVQQILQVKCEAWNLSRKPKQALPILDRDEFASLKNKKRSSLQGLLE